MPTLVLDRTLAVGAGALANRGRACREAVPSIVADYRASAGVDPQHDLVDRDSGRRLTMPVTVVQQDWGSALGFDAAALCSAWAADLDHRSVSWGHFMAEEQPVAVARMIRELLDRQELHDGRRRRMLTRSRRTAAASVVAALTLAAGLTAGCAPAPARDDPTGTPTAAVRPAAPAPASPGSASPTTASPTTAPTSAASVEAFVDLEDEFDARLGVLAVDTGSGRTVEHRADERFAVASTQKALAAAALLDSLRPAEVDEVVRWTDADLVAHSPVTEQRTATGMTWRELAAAAVTHSDNTAANLVLGRVGGPEGLEAALRDLGDGVTSADRLEPELNDVGPSDERDTSTARALAADLRAYLLDGALDPAHADLLLGWMSASTTGAGLVRAGVPAGWSVADRSGGGPYGIRNDLAVVQPPGGAPVVVAILSDRSGRSDPDVAYDDALLARATQVVLERLGLVG